ncbi:MAG: radical SAM family heme chaperone HemW [Candidatus Sumerlaeota bacterium]|nr:radical SAM family heme chaperone HemW [Candidatus Sumerlaeota bacterium]
MISHLYIHTPFCRRKCPYCDFYSIKQAPGDEALRRRYFQAVVKEWELLLAENAQNAVADAEAWTLRRPPETIYLGGGTPSLVGAKLYEMIIRSVSVEGVDGVDKGVDGVDKDTNKNKCEFTVEINPDSAAPDVLRGFRRLGANRFSFGVQSFSDAALRTLGRIHDAAQARAALEQLSALPEMNGAAISLDLIFAIPGQTLADWRSDLAAAVAFKPSHISAYGLTYYEGTRLIEARRLGDIEPANEELEAQMFESAHETLTAAGYDHYEISNYALPGCACRHNQAVWRGEDYLGLGAAAHSRAGERRWSNPQDVEAYCREIESGRLPRLFHDAPAAGPSWRAERLMLGLRTREGVDMAQWPAAEREAFLREHGKDMDHLAAEALAVCDGARLALTLKGWLVYDAILRRWT